MATITLIHGGNLFASKAQVLVNTVNCRGAMGKGLALKFKQLWPEIEAPYRARCADGRLAIGQLHLVRRPAGSPKPWVLNFPTKDDWRNPSQLAYIEAGMAAFVASARHHQFQSIAFPPLGCGLGGLKWAEVWPIMQAAFDQLADLPIVIEVYAPDR